MPSLPGEFSRDEYLWKLPVFPGPNPCRPPSGEEPDPTQRAHAQYFAFNYDADGRFLTRKERGNTPQQPAPPPSIEDGISEVMDALAMVLWEPPAATEASARSTAAPPDDGNSNNNNGNSDNNVDDDWSKDLPSPWPDLQTSSTSSALPPPTRRFRPRYSQPFTAPPPHRSQGPSRSFRPRSPPPRASSSRRPPSPMPSRRSSPPGHWSPPRRDRYPPPRYERPPSPRRRRSASPSRRPPSPRRELVRHDGRPTPSVIVPPRIVDEFVYMDESDGTIQTAPILHFRSRLNRRIARQERSRGERDM
jgi:hypothetical protein